MPSPGATDSIVRFLETNDGQRLSIIVFSIVATLVLLAFPGGAAAFVFGIPFLFFVPGFAVVRLFFWKGTSIETKFVLSLGLSILVDIFLALILVLTPIGLSTDSTRASLVLFALGAVAFDVLWKRPAVTEKKAAAEEQEKVPKTIQLDKVVAAMLVTALAVSGVSLALIITAEYPSRTYFALTDTNERADINTTRPINSTLSLIVHMKNGEEGSRTFRMVAHNDTLFEPQEFWNNLTKGQVWNQSVDIYLRYYGIYRIDFDLYIQEAGHPEYFYGNLHLWIEVY